MHKPKVNIRHWTLFVLISTSILFCYSLIKPSERKLPEAKEIKLELSFPNLKKKYKDECHDSSLFARVVIFNHTDSVVSFFEDWNSWGYFNVSFEIKTDKNLVRQVFKISRDWDKNFPSFKILFPGDSMDLSYNLTAMFCQKIDFTGTIPKPGEGLKSIKAIYQLDSAVLGDTEVDNRIIKYKYEWMVPFEDKSLGRSNKKDNDIIDSVKTPQHLRMTFPLNKFISNEVIF